MTPRRAVLVVLLSALTGATAGALPAGRSAEAAGGPSTTVPAMVLPVDPLVPDPIPARAPVIVAEPDAGSVPAGSVPAGSVPAAAEPAPPVTAAVASIPAFDLRSLVPVVPTRAEPARVAVPAIGLEATSVVPIGVLVDGRLEVPGPSAVGWYRYGPRPGEAGSTVLAAHVAYGGEPGPFLRLAAVAVHDEVVVTGSDGVVTVWRVASVDLVDKSVLPGDQVFARTGPSVLTLITCGGEFDFSQGHYRQNVVVRAVPQ